MSTTELHSLDLLTIPVWIVLPHTEELVFKLITLHGS